MKGPMHANSYRQIPLLLACLVATSACGPGVGISDTPQDGGDAGFQFQEEAGVTDTDVVDPGSDAETTPDQGAETPDQGSSNADVAVDEPDMTPPPVDACANQDKAPPNPATREAINDDPAFIQVYNNNIENLKLASEQCRGDWTDLIYYMKTVQPSPDLFLVQQISDRAQLDVLVDRMTRELPGAFAGIIAEANPDPQRSPCGPEKALQTNAIIYRTGRFETVGSKHVWQSWANKNDRCVRNHQARTKNVMIKLHDKIANKDVTVASLHWSTSQGGGPDPACALKNVIEADEKVTMNGFGDADLLVLAGDLNEPDRRTGGGFRPWHQKVNGDRGGDLNFRDVIFRECQGAANLQTCLDNNWTIGQRARIDFVFAKDGEGCRARMRRPHTVTFNEADAAAKQVTGSDDPLNYSDHRAVRVELYY